MDKLTYQEEEKALNFYALEFEEFLRENFQPGTMSMEHALNMLHGRHSNRLSFPAIRGQDNMSETQCPFLFERAGDLKLGIVLQLPRPDAPLEVAYQESLSPSVVPVSGERLRIFSFAHHTERADESVGYTNVQIIYTTLQVLLSPLV